jgi:hypothetical protein
MGLIVFFLVALIFSICSTLHSLHTQIPTLTATITPISTTPTVTLSPTVVNTPTTTDIPAIIVTATWTP